MDKAVFTTLLTHTAANDYGNVYTTSLIHRSAGLIARGSALVAGNEVYLVRVTKAGESTFHGRTYSADEKLTALDDYNARVGTFLNV